MIISVLTPPPKERIYMNNITQSLDADWEQKILSTNLNDDFKKTYISAIRKENSIQKKLYLYTMSFQWNEIANTF